VPASPASGAASPAPATPDIGGFWRRFAHNLGVYSGVLPKGTPPARPSSPPSEAGGFDAWLRRAASAAAPVPAQAPEAPYSPQPAARSTAGAPKDPLSTQHAELNTGATAGAPKDPRSTQHAAHSTGAPEVPLSPPQSVPSTGAPAGAPTVDYNAAIERMKQFGRMERPAQRTPLGGWIPPAPFGTPPPAPPEPAAGLGEDPLESVLSRMARRTDRLARMAAREDRRQAE
jgi:hypothetical protein